MRMVIAVGGNSLIKDAAHISTADQASAAAESLEQIAEMVAAGWEVVITHGNGPQVGFMLRRAELATAELPTLPLDILGADTQGATGYMFSQALTKAFAQRGINKQAVAVVTQTVIDAHDPALLAPTKPIGSFLTEEAAKKNKVENGWHVVEDSGRGWRRVVASPLPQRIVELDAIKTLLAAGFTVIAGGGGGIPVVEIEGSYRGVDAVIDKDLASALLANNLQAETYVISTAVEAVAINFGKDNQQWLSHIDAAQAREYLQAGEFGAGSMAPKIAAALAYLDGGGKRVIITSPAKLCAALRGEAGTQIVP